MAAAAPSFFGLLIPFPVGAFASLVGGFLLVVWSSPLVDNDASTSDPLSLSTFQAPCMWLSIKVAVEVTIKGVAVTVAKGVAVKVAKNMKRDGR